MPKVYEKIQAKNSSFKTFGIQSYLQEKRKYEINIFRIIINILYPYMIWFEAEFLIFFPSHVNDFSLISIFDPVSCWKMGINVNLWLIT